MEGGEGLRGATVIKYASRQNRCAPNDLDGRRSGGLSTYPYPETAARWTYPLRFR